MEVEQSCSKVGPITRQQALRLVIGMGYDPEAALVKWQQVVSWRREHQMDALRARLNGVMCGQDPVRFSHEADVYSKLFRGCPCALLCADGRPVSVWHAGAADTSNVGTLPLEYCRTWSQEVFEYADLWITKDTERTSCLTGYIQVYNMQGLSLRQVTSMEVKDRLKAALSAGGFYVEAIAHIYVVNASRLFSMVSRSTTGKLLNVGSWNGFETGKPEGTGWNLVPLLFDMVAKAWKLVRGFLSPWTASKITVSSTVPDELIATWRFKEALHFGGHVM